MKRKGGDSLGGGVVPLPWDLIQPRPRKTLPKQMTVKMTVVNLGHQWGGEEMVRRMERVTWKHVHYHELNR